MTALLIVLGALAVNLTLLHLIHRRFPLEIEGAIEAVFDLVRTPLSRSRPWLSGFASGLDARRSGRLTAMRGTHPVTPFAVTIGGASLLWLTSVSIAFVLERNALMEAGQPTLIATMVAVPLAMLPCIGSLLIMGGFGAGELKAAAKKKKSAVSLGTLLLLVAVATHVWGGVMRADTAFERRAAVLATTQGIVCTADGTASSLDDPSGSPEIAAHVAGVCDKVLQDRYFSAMMQGVLAFGLVVLEIAGSGALVRGILIGLLGVSFLATRTAGVIHGILQFVEEIVVRVCDLLMLFLRIGTAAHPPRIKLPQVNAPAVPVPPAVVAPNVGTPTPAQAPAGWSPHQGAAPTTPPVINLTTSTTMSPVIPASQSNGAANP